MKSMKAKYRIIIFNRGLLFLLLMGSLQSSANERSETTGEVLYQRCAACHLKTAKGVPGMFPPLNQRLGPLMASQQGRDYLAMVVQAGLMGSIDVEGVTYRGIMPAQGMAMDDDEVAQLLNYVLQTFNANSLGGNLQGYTKAEIAAIKSRYPKATGRDVHTLRQSAFENVK